MFKSALTFMGVMALSGSVYAAKFTSVKKMKDASLENLATVASKAVSNEDLFGDCSDLMRFKVTKKESEKNINTIKQLHYSKLGLYPGDDADPFLIQREKSSVIAKNLLSHGAEYNDWFDSDEDKSTFFTTVDNVARALDTALDSKTKAKLELYDGYHSYEDGTWSILSAYDTINQELLVIKIGFCGT